MMEKNESARISIKLNGKVQEPPKQPANPQKNRQTVETVKQQVAPQGLTDPEESAIDRLQQIRNDKGSRLERAKSVEEEARTDEPFESGDARRGRTDVFLLPTRRKSRLVFRKNAPLTWIVSAFSAIAIGLLFGFLVLAVFTQEQLNDSYRSVIGQTIQSTLAPRSSQQQTGDSAAALPSAENQATPSAPGQPLSVNLPEQRLFMAQVGAFTDKAAAQQAIDSLEKKGYPNFLYKEAESYYLFTATTSNRDDILGLASSFKGKGMDVYVKEVSLPGLQQEIAVKSDATASPGLLDQGQVASFFQNGMELSSKMANWSGKFLSDPKTGKLTPEEELAIKELHRKFLDASRALQSAAPQAWQNHLTGMINGLNQAVSAITQTKTAIGAGKSENAESYAWQVQAGAIAYLEHYTLWIEEQGPKGE